VNLINVNSASLFSIHAQYKELTVSFLRILFSYYAHAVLPIVFKLVLFQSLYVLYIDILFQSTGSRLMQDHINGLDIIK